MTLRDGAARVLRALPPFRGKGRVGLALHRLLPGADGPVWVTMRGGWRVLLDLRVPPERFPYWTGAYDDDYVLLGADRLGEGTTALDVGANIGLFTIPLALSARERGARVIAFEPVPANLERLRAGLAANGLDEVVTVMPFALGAARGRLRLAPEAGALGGNAGRSTEGIDVELRTLDELDGLGACTFVKIDVEGGELDVLRGGERFFRHARPRIVLELNRPWMEAFGWSVADLRELSERWGYALDAPDGPLELATLEPR